LEDVAISFRCDFAIYDAVISNEPYERLNVVIFMSSMYNRKRTDPRTCVGTPDVTHVFSDRAPLTETLFSM